MTALTPEERSVLAELERQFPRGSGEPVRWRRYILRAGRWMPAIGWTCLVAGAVLTLVVFDESLRAGLTAYVVALLGLGLVFVSDRAARPSLNAPTETDSGPLDEVERSPI